MSKNAFLRLSCYLHFGFDINCVKGIFFKNNKTVESTQNVCGIVHVPMFLFWCMLILVKVGDDRTLHLIGFFNFFHELCFEDLKKISVNTSIFLDFHKMGQEHATLIVLVCMKLNVYNCM